MTSVSTNLITILAVTMAFCNVNENGAMYHYPPGLQNLINKVHVNFLVMCYR